MRITVNLASRPYVDLAQYYQRLRIWVAIFAVLAIPLVLLLHFESSKASQAAAQAQQTHQQLLTLQREQSGFQSQMHQPQNAAVLSQAQYLNDLFKQKAFSWTAVMMDLENVLPPGVQVSALEPAITPEGRVTLRMRVAGPRDLSVTLIRNLEHSRRFLYPRLASETADTSGGGSNQAMLLPVTASSSVNFDILADYNPLAPGEKPVLTLKAEEKPSPETPAIHPPLAGKPPVAMKPHPRGGKR